MHKYPIIFFKYGNNSRSAKIMTMPMMVTPLSSPTPYDCGDHAHGWATEGRR